MAFLGTALGQAAPLRRWLAGLHGVPSKMSERDDAHAPTYIISYRRVFLSSSAATHAWRKIVLVDEMLHQRWLNPVVKKTEASIGSSQSKWNKCRVTHAMLSCPNPRDKAMSGGPQILFIRRIVTRRGPAVTWCQG
jgi:hypothetical protein